MNTGILLNKDGFLKRLITLCLRSGLTDFPKDVRDQHVLLKSAMIGLDDSQTFTEKEINEFLKNWIDQVCQIKGIDQVTLRRHLIDAGYLTRTKDGSTYQVSTSGPHRQYFDESIEKLDIPGEIDKARQEIERRKREFLQKKK